MEVYLLFFVVFDQRTEDVKQRTNDSDDDDEPAAVYEENWSGGAATPRRNQHPTPNTRCAGHCSGASPAVPPPSLLCGRVS